MKKKLRLILWTDCPRQCPGCCNNDWDIAGLPVPTSYMGYDEIILTGGEPLMFAHIMENVLEMLRDLTEYQFPKTKFILYTAMYNKRHYAKVLPLLDGMTVTLHDQSDVVPFLELCDWLRANEPLWKGKSLRLNVFAGIEVPSVIDLFQVKSGITWIKNCPLPEGEVLARLT